MRLTGNDSDARACRGTGCPKAGDGPKVGVGASRPDVLQDIHVKILFQPVRVDVFGALVDGE